MYATTSVAITRPTDPVTARLSGPDLTIPIIRFGEDVEVHVNSTTLSPAEQEAWLRDLSAKVTVLADEVSELHRTAVAR